MKKQTIQIFVFLLGATITTGSSHAITAKQQQRLSNALEQSQVYSKKIATQFDQFSNCLNNPTCSPERLKELAKGATVNLGTLKANLKTMKILGFKRKSGLK